MPLNLPLILGWDFSGVIEAAGPQTTHFKAGHEVFGRPDPLRDGAYAQYLVRRGGAWLQAPLAGPHSVRRAGAWRG